MRQRNSAWNVPVRTGCPSGPSTRREPGSPLPVRYIGTSNVPRTRRSTSAFTFSLTCVTWKLGVPAPSCPYASSRMCSMRPARLSALATVKSHAR